MISALTFAVANHSPKGRESQLSVTVDDFEEPQEQKEPGEQREQSLAEKRVLCTSSFSEPPSNRRNHRKSVQWARRLSRLGPRPTPRSLERTSHQRKGLLPRSERQELAELVKNRMKNLGLSTAGYDEMNESLSSYSYVLLNPSPDTKLELNDIVYIIRQEPLSFVPNTPGSRTSSFGNCQWISENPELESQL
ncbi:potassium channel subfamily T member 2-like [Clupea harengus]|uniref:Potassium channel subfamily T member 2-like n=1 Tax=Clupea harengus TaxID=7950 RepID=A0A8M1KKV4_CLUHA|nr:potassium channel subfamily T member 2-like [Clupea harengus]